MDWKNYKSDLRKPQILALELIENYLKSNNSDSSLVHMPTGSGKSGIISMISNILFDDSILIVTPRVSITEQLYKDVSARFLEVINKKANPKGKKFQLLDESFNIDSKKLYSDYIFVSTIQRIDWIRMNKPDLFTILTKKIKLVIFDEGHYEPAYSWSQTIRSFACKKILFTATPFRNDLKPFEISPDFIYPYSYKEAVVDGYLREVNFNVVSTKFNDKTFIDICISFYKSKFGEFTKNSPKMIIRCKHRTTIRRLVNFLVKHHPQIPTIGIHDRFNDSKSSVLVKSVPSDVKSHEAKIWIHQNKLLEGIDDSGFQILATYDRFENDRSLIQQIGRIVRIEKTKGEKSFVIDFTGGDHQKIWSQYLAFDRQLEKNSFLPISTRVVKKLADIGNEFEYLFDGFKQKLDIEAPLSVEDLQIPSQVNLLETDSKYSDQLLFNFLAERLSQEDRYGISQEFNINKSKVRCFFYFTISPTPFLKEHYSVNVGNDLIIFFSYKGLLCYYESTGYVPLNESKIGIKGSISPSKLKRLFNRREDQTIDSVSLKNSNLGANSIRTHGYSARSIDNTISYLDDSSNIVSTLTGKHKIHEKVKIERERNSQVENLVTIISRYVGIERGRVTQKGELLVLSEYIGWVKSIVDICLDKSYVPKETFNRYSKVVSSVLKPIPKNILVDFSEIEEDFRTGSTIVENGDVIKARSNLNFDDLCSNVIEENQGGKTKYYFDLKLKGSIKRKVYLEYNIKSQTYSIYSDELDELYVAGNNSQYKTVTEFLNKRQSFKIIPEQSNTIYTFGSFYEAMYSFGRHFKPNEFYLLNSLIPIPELEKVTSEKGKNSDPVTKGSWSSSSIFGLVDTLGRRTGLSKYLGKPDFVVCDDMGTEIADFICCYDSDQDNQKVIFIHAKISDDKKYSASGLQVVCGQATKNIRYLNSYNTAKPPNINRWDKPWKMDGLTVTKRIRLNSKILANEAWLRIESVIKNPSSIKEVWLLLGKTLSKQTLIDELKKTTYEAVQAVLLLQSAHQNIGTVNSKLKVFCSP